MTAGQIGCCVLGNVWKRARPDLFSRTVCGIKELEICLRDWVVCLQAISSIFEESSVHPSAFITHVLSRVEDRTFQPIHLPPGSSDDTVARASTGKHTLGRSIVGVVRYQHQHQPSFTMLNLWRKMFTWCVMYHNAG